LSCAILEGRRPWQEFCVEQRNQSRQRQHQKNTKKYQEWKRLHDDVDARLLVRSLQYLSKACQITTVQEYGRMALSIAILYNTNEISIDLKQTEIGTLELTMSYAEM
jgi:hypothetical protein